MTIDQFIKSYIDDALSISALCSDLGLSRDDAKLFTYIHVKSMSSPAGIECFNDAAEQEILALQIMLGIKRFPSIKPEVPLDEPSEAAIGDFTDTLSDRIKELDYIADEGRGLESYFRSELFRRLRFHQDPEYRKEKLKVYMEKIYPRMKEYTKKKVFEVFERERNEGGRIVLNFRDSLN